jgi:hypothetical protein
MLLLELCSNSVQRLQRLVRADFLCILNRLPARQQQPLYVKNKTHYYEIFFTEQYIFEVNKA